MVTSMFPVFVKIDILRPLACDRRSWLFAGRKSAYEFSLGKELFCCNVEAVKLSSRMAVQDDSDYSKFKVAGYRRR